jgi:hypothetical protein
VPNVAKHLEQCCKACLPNVAKHWGQCCKACLPNVAKHLEQCCKTCLPNVAKHWEQCWKTCLPNVAKHLNLEQCCKACSQNVAKHSDRAMSNAAKHCHPQDICLCAWFQSIIYLCWFQIVYNHETTQIQIWWRKAHQSDRKNRNERRRGGRTEH